MPFDYLFSITCRGPTTPALCWFGLLRFRSPLLSESLLFSSPPGTKMFQFPGLPSLKLCIGLRMIKLFNFIGFPHSDTPGSLPVYDSPRRFAVICVLLLLYMPRHPPYALTNLITYIRLCFTRTVNYFVLDFLVNLVITTFRKRPIYCLLLLFSFQRTATPSELPLARSLKTKQVIKLLEQLFTSHLSP